MQGKGLAPDIPRVQFPASSSQSDFSDMFLEQLPSFLHSHLNLVPHLFGEQLDSDLFPHSEVAVHSAEISSLTLRCSSTAVLRYCLKQLGSSTKPQTISNMPRPDRHAVGICKELDPREIPVHRYTGESK